MSRLNLRKKMIYRIKSAICIAASTGWLLGASLSVLAAEIRISGGTGECEYHYNSLKDIRFTRCAAQAFIVNVQSSEVYSCAGSVEGDQYVVPSVQETAPETITCTRLGQPFAKKGVYDIQAADDTAKAERNLNRLQGALKWKNAFWIYSGDSNDLKLCVARLPDSVARERLDCSRKLTWDAK
jgi:hypothetical protein